MKKISGLIYTSNAVVAFDAGQLQELSQKAAIRNKQLGITGYLYYENKRFLQYIEGAVDEMEELMQRIEKDPRHEIIAVMRQPDLEKRKFPDWNMKWLERPMLVSIKMENILSGFILMLKNEAVEKSSENEARVWEMVDRISGFRNELV